MEADQGKMEQVRRNPLEIPEILERILECLPLKDLKASRLVSKRWRDCGIVPMKEKEKSGVRLENFCKYNNNTINDLAEFVKCLDSVARGNANFPCSKVFVSASLIRQNEKERHEDEVLFANFLQKISPWVTELGLTIDLRTTITTNAFPLSLNFPKLELLRLASYGIVTTNPSKGSAENFYRFVTSILEKAPSLRKVNFNVAYHSVHTTIKAMKSSFTEMEIYGHINNSSLEKLSTWDGERNLKSLHLSFYSKSEVNNTSLFQLFRSHNHSLETLVMNFVHNSSPIVVSFPEMPKLRNLTIKLHINFNDDDELEELVTFPEISYQRQFPALKTLHLNPGECLWETSLCKQFIKQKMPPVETIEELTLPSEEESLLTQSVVKIFPNVKKLKVPATTTILPTIFKHWTSLEQLTLHYHVVTARLYDSVNRMLMGQTPSEYKRLQERIEREGENFDWNRLEPGNAEESIINLQKLRVLKIENTVDSKELGVGRAPLHLILSRIPSLKCVDFGDRRCHMETKIDKAWWARLNEDCVVLWNHI